MSQREPRTPQDAMALQYYATEVVNQGHELDRETLQKVSNDFEDLLCRAFPEISPEQVCYAAVIVGVTMAMSAFEQMPPPPEEWKVQLNLKKSVLASLFMTLIQSPEGHTSADDLLASFVAEAQGATKQ